MNVSSRSCYRIFTDVEVQTTPTFSHLAISSWNDSDECRIELWNIGLCSLYNASMVCPSLHPTESRKQSSSPSEDSQSTREDIEPSSPHPNGGGSESEDLSTTEAMVVTEVQRGLCTDRHWTKYPKCRSCDRKQTLSIGDSALDLCRFRGFRAIYDGDPQFIKAVDPTEQGSDFVFTTHIPKRLPSHVEVIEVSHSSVSAVS
jgi:hypothetical protein